MPGHKIVAVAALQLLFCGGIITLLFAPTIAVGMLAAALVLFLAVRPS